MHEACCPTGPLAPKHAALTKSQKIFLQCVLSDTHDTALTLRGYVAHDVVQGVLACLEWHKADPLVLISGWQALHALLLLAPR